MIKTLPLDLLWLFFLILLSYGMGKKTFSFLGFDLDPDLDPVFSVGLGLVFLSTLTFALAFFGLLYRLIFLILFVLLYLLTFREIKQFIAQGALLWTKVKGKMTIPFKASLLSILFIAILCNLIFSYSPPTQAREMLYDLTLPKLYVQAHRMFDIPYQKEFYYPLQIQMLYTMALCVKGVLLAKLIHFFFGLLCAGLVFCFTKLFFGGREAFFALVIFYLMPLTASLSGAANIDLGTMFYGSAAVLAFMLFYKEKNLPYLLLSGFFSGVCLGTKVTGLMVPATLFVMTGFVAVRLFRESLWSAVQKMMVFSFMTLVGFLPWILRNIHFSKNPIMPFSFPLFGWHGHEMAIHEMSENKVLHANISLDAHLSGLHNLLFGDFIFGGGPLLFAFLLAAYFREKDKDHFRLVFAAAAINFVLLFFTLPYPHHFYETRYYGVSTALLAVLAGSGLEYCLTWFASKKMIHALLFTGLVFPGLTFTLLFAAKRVPLLIGKESPETYVESKLRFFNVVKYANENLNENSRVALVGSSDANAYYWKAFTLVPYVSVLQERDLDKVVHWLNANQITHALFFKNFYKKDEAAGVYLNIEHPEETLGWDMERFRESHFVQVYEDPDVILYRVDYLDDSNKV